MSRFKKGFTLIEVALFLAITGALFAAITVGVQHSISQQRFNDAVQNFTEFLRNVYAETMNVQNLKGGRSGKAIYGRLISFGETKDTMGNSINTNDTRNTIYVYDIVGDIDEDGLSGNVLESLDKLNADVVMVEGKDLKPVGIVENYVPKWSSQIEPACIGNTCSYDPFVGAVLIVRHPGSGTVYTYVYEGESLDVNGEIALLKGDYSIAEAQLLSDDEAERQSAQAIIDDIVNGLKNKNILRKYLSKFSMKHLDFCVNPEGDAEYSSRRNVRIVKGARNASGVEILTDEQNNCIDKE